jgi:hypothetical protein
VVLCFTHVVEKFDTFFFLRPSRGEFKKKKNAVAPVEAGSIGSTVSVVWKEKTVVFVRDRVRVERAALGIAGGQSKVVETVQDEASPTTRFLDKT